MRVEAGVEFLDYPVKDILHKSYIMGSYYEAFRSGGDRIEI